MVVLASSVSDTVYFCSKNSKTFDLEMHCVKGNIRELTHVEVFCRLGTSNLCEGNPVLVRVTQSGRTDVRY